jgi:anti-sigma regulatory factor (Ser/Thr protein kinase)
MNASAAQSLVLRIPAVPELLRVIREQVREAAERMGCDAECTAEIVLAVNEACMNVMQHAYRGRSDGEIVLRMRNNGDSIEVQVEDTAAPVDVSTIVPRCLDEVRPGGLGTHFMRSVMDECIYGRNRQGDGNLLRMIKSIRKSGGAGRD